MTAALAAPPVSSRRVSAGIRPADGATSRLPAWWGRDDWLTEVADALDASPELLREHHVSRDAALAVARGMAAFADHRSGRDCRPTNERLVAALRCSLSTVQRGRRALKALGFVVVLVRGRSMMTRAERLAAWRRGSAHRQVAEEFALCSRPRRAPRRTAASLSGGARFLRADLHIVEDDTPPGAEIVSAPRQTRSSSPRRRTENEERRSAPRTNQGPAGARSRRLAEEVRDRLGWLHGQSWKRLAPLLARFARQDWTVTDVELTVRDVLAVRGHRVPRELRHPAAYLAGLLRGVDEAERPSVAEAAYEAAMREQAAATRAARRRWHDALAAGHRCSHGVPAGDVPDTVSGAVACLDCRRMTR